MAGCFKLVRGTNDTTPFGVEKMSENTDCNNSFSGKIQPNEILMNHKLRIKCKHCLAAHFWQADITFYFIFGWIAIFMENNFRKRHFEMENKSGTSAAAAAQHQRRQQRLYDFNQMKVQFDYGADTFNQKCKM